MTEHTPEKVAGLIAEARDLIAHTKTYNFGMWSADKLAHEVAGKLADALEAVSAERDEARIWAETMQAQKFEWEGKEATVRTERDEALAVIADAREVLMPVYPASLGPVGEELVRILSRIPEHPKED